MMVETAHFGSPMHPGMPSLFNSAAMASGFSPFMNSSNTLRTIAACASLMTRFPFPSLS